MRVSTLVAIVLWAAIAIAIVAVAAMTLSEMPKARYATAAAAEEEGAFVRGWLPSVLKAGTADIEEEHDLDTNHGRATFHFSSKFAIAIQRDCVRWPSNSHVAAPFRSWPEFLQTDDTAGTLAARHINIFKCREFTIATDSTSNNGYLWH